MVVRRLRPLPIEAIVRGYLIGSGWREYRATGGVCGIGLPEGLREAERLPETLFTPSTKAEAGEHDENIDFETACRLIGSDVAHRVRDARPRPLPLRGGARPRARNHHRGHQVRVRGGRRRRARPHRRGADPGLFAVLARRRVRPGNEPARASTSSSSATTSTPSTGTRRPPAPALPAEVIAKTAEKYREAERRLVA